MNRKQFLLTLSVAIISAFLGGTFGVWLLMPPSVLAQDEPQRVIKAQNFKVVDSEGKTRAWFGISDVLAILNEFEGEPPPEPQLVFIDQKNTRRVLIQPTPSLTLRNEAGEVVWSAPESVQRSSTRSLGSPISQLYSGLGSGHWISEKSSGGKMIILEDGSIWEINSLDQIYTLLWLVTESITVLESQSAIGDYKYLLINTDNGEKALAKYLARQ